MSAGGGRMPVAGKCWGCAHRVNRFAGRRVVVWCAKWGEAADARCTAYRAISGAVNAAYRMYAFARPR